MTHRSKYGLRRVAVGVAVLVALSGCEASPVLEKKEGRAGCRVHKNVSGIERVALERSGCYSEAKGGVKFGW
ncbi:hypothetical protein LMG33818_000955 [Halomonadaceae bacterium LMG 33818]|uniref:hypothetical protein n=1 Tax=Cernens ardua TaxID=3402176 RepID=UPI003EDC0AA6